jgi:biotin transport system substrate-specific component
MREAPPVSHKSPIESRDLARIAVFAALIAALGLPGTLYPLGTAVPITAQTLGVMLAGAVLGPWRGAAAVLTFEILVLVGLPLLAGGRGGPGVFVAPSAGFLVGWIIGAFVVGLIAHPRDGRPSWWRVVVGAVVGGIGVIYALGIPVLALVLALPLAQAAAGSAIFLPGDLIKVTLTVLIVLALGRAYPAAFGRHSVTAPSVPQVQTERTGAHGV